MFYEIMVKTDSVTRFGDILPLLYDVIKLWPFERLLLVFGQTFEHTLLNFLEF